MTGDAKLVTLDVASVRFAPIWVNELKSWQVTVVKVEMKGHGVPKVQCSLIGVMVFILQLIFSFIKSDKFLLTEILLDY